MITLEVTVRDKNNNNSKRLKLKKKKKRHTGRNDNPAMSGFEFSTEARVQPLGHACNRQRLASCQLWFLTLLRLVVLLLFTI